MTRISIDVRPDLAKEIEEIEPTNKLYAFRCYAKLKTIDAVAKADIASLETITFYFLDTIVTNDDVEMLITEDENGNYKLISRTFTDKSVVSYTDVVVDIPREMFVSLRKSVTIGYKVMIYKLPVLDNPELFWEVMVFWDNQGNIHPWVMVTCVQHENFNPTLPFDASEVIIENDPYNSREDLEFIDRLWNKEYARIDERDIAKV